MEERQAVETAAIKRQKDTLDIDINIVKQQRVEAEIEAEAEQLESNDSKSVNLALNLANGVEKVQTFLKNPQVAPVKAASVSDNDQYNQLTKFLLRKDLAMSRLTNFNDKPENYDSWKNSFKSVCVEMGVSPAEELDLLVKWLGATSQKHAINVRSAHSHDPALGLERVWERLSERYGTVENIHTSILRKLDRFLFC